MQLPYSRGVDNFFKVGGASYLELPLMPLGGSGGMPPQEIFDFSCPEIASAVSLVES